MNAASSTPNQIITEEGSEEKKETFKEGCNAPQKLEDSEMRGVHAKTNIPSNTICVSIPLKCLITVEMGQATEIGQIILRSDLDLDAPKHIFLMIFLLWDRKVNNQKSFFAPYYNVLPETLRNIPIFWSPEELAWLQGSYLLNQISDRNEAIEQDYLAICKVAPQLASIATLEEFKWARMCVCSRNFGLQVNGHRTSALVPHADMLNHYRPRETKWTYDDDLQAFTITTLKPIMLGSQVYDSYGQKCNHRFLLNYGFAVEDNTESDGFCPNEVPIKLSISPNDPNYSQKHAFWTRGDDGTNALTAAVAAAAAGVARSHYIDPSSMVTSAMEAAAAVADIQGRKGSKSILAPKRLRINVSNNENTRVLFSMLRVLVADKDELESLMTAPALPFGDDGHGGYLMGRTLRGLSATASISHLAASQHTAFYRTSRDIRHPISIRNERAAMRRLLEVISAALDKYPCSLAQDCSDLMDEDSCPRFSNRRHAKIQIRGEKEVLHHFALWAQTSLEVLSIIEREVAIENGEISSNDNEMKGFEQVTREMEEEEGVGSSSLHHTIVRYCCDVLGSLRREQMNLIRRSSSRPTGPTHVGQNPTLET